MSSRPPCVFTSRAWAVSVTVWPVASCHLACTGTITGNRLLRRSSPLDGGVEVMSSSTRKIPRDEGSVSPVLGQAQKGGACSIYQRSNLVEATVGPMTEHCGLAALEAKGNRVAACANPVCY